MKVSELTLDVVKQYLRVDDNSDDILLKALQAAAIQYCTSYMGCTTEDLNKYDDVTIVILALISDSYEVRQFTTSTVTLNPVMQGVLDLHCSNFIAGDLGPDTEPDKLNEVKLYHIIWGLAQPGSGGTLSRGYLEYNVATGFGKLHIDMTMPTNVGAGTTICKLPDNAPVPISLIEVVPSGTGGSVYIEPSSRDIKICGVAGPKRYICDLVGFWKVTT